MHSTPEKTSAIRHLGPVVRNGQTQPISAATAWQDLIFVSGQVPMHQGQPCASDITGQTHATIDMIEGLLHNMGSSLEHVLKATVWLTDATDYPAFNEAYAQRFPAAQAPARSTVISGLIAPVKIEMEVIAVRSENR